MTPLPRQGCFFNCIFKMVFLEILASANMAGFSLDSHIYACECPQFAKNVTIFQHE